MPTPARKRFQIHLSTAIVMMFVAGALIWANVMHWPYGWPAWAANWNKPGTGNVGAVIIDGSTALAILYVTWFLCEWLIRRRTARKGT